MEYVTTRHVGRARVSLIDDGQGGWAPQLSAPEAEWRAAMPEADANGSIDFDHYTGLIQIGDARVLVDLGFDDPSSGSRFMPPRYRRSPGVTAGLASLGVTPEQVTHVIITHHHEDHIAGGIVGNRARFPNARHYIGRRDWDGNPALERADSLESIHLGGLERLGQLELVDDDREVVSGVTMIHAPGESPGHSIVRVRSAGETLFLVGDLFHHPCEVEHLSWVSPGRDPAAMRRSRERLIAEALATEALITFSHAKFPGWGRLARRDGGATWQLL